MKTWTWERHFTPRNADWYAILSDGVLIAEINRRDAQDEAEFIVQACNEKEQRDADIRRQNDLPDSVRVIEVAPWPALKAYPLTAPKE